MKLMQDAAWTLDFLKSPNSVIRATQLPSLDHARALCKELHDEWLEADVSYTDLIPWACERFNLEVDGNWSVDDMERGVKLRRYQYTQLLMLITDLNATGDNDFIDMTINIQRVMAACKQTLFDSFDDRLEKRNWYAVACAAIELISGGAVGFKHGEVIRGALLNAPDF